jgi:hypothetical protein
MGSGVLLALGPPDQERNAQREAPLGDFVLSKMFSRELGQFFAPSRKEVCLLPDQIKPIEPLVPVN